MFHTRKKQAKLPEDMEEGTIGSMLPGDTAYTVHWAMWVDSDRNCWLNSAFPAWPQSGGTMCMKVERRPDGSFHVWIDQSYGHKYTINERSGVGVPLDSEQFAVTKLHR